MALPGGRQQAGETDYHTAVREVEEEVGLELAAPAAADGSEVLYIGRMSDRHINSYGNVKPLAVCPFIFLLTTPTPPALRLDSKEVGAAVWAPLSYFTTESVRFGYMVHPLVIQTRDRWQRRGGRRKVEVGYRVRRMDNSLSAPSLPAQAPSSVAAGGGGVRGLLPVKLPSLFSLPSVQFPALALPGEFETADGRRGISLGDTLLYQPMPTTGHASASASASSSYSIAASSPSPLLSTPVAPTSSLPIRSADDPIDPSTSSTSTRSTDADGDGDDGFSSKMEHDIDVAPGHTTTPTHIHTALLPSYGHRPSLSSLCVACLWHRYVHPVGVHTVGGERPAARWVGCALAQRSDRRRTKRQSAHAALAAQIHRRDGAGGERVEGDQRDVCKDAEWR